MAHQIENMFSVKQVPWHGLGKIVQDAPATEDAMKMAGLDWQVRLSELTTDHGHVVEARAVVRDTDGKVMGVVGNSYHPVQNTEAFKFFDPFITNKEAIYETAGSLKDGQKVWILAKIKRDPIQITKNDIVNKYLLLANSHDGSMSLRIGYTPIRVVCANTLAMALTNKNDKFFKLIHTKKIVDNLEKVHEAIDAADQKFNLAGELYKELSKKQVKKAQIKPFVDAVFVSQMRNYTSERKDIALEKINTKIVELFETGYGNTEKDISGSWWALYNGVTQYLSHDKGKDQDRRLNELWFGQNQKINVDALWAAKAMAHV